MCINSGTEQVCKGKTTLPIAVLFVSKNHNFKEKGLRLNHRYLFRIQTVVAVQSLSPVQLFYGPTDCSPPASSVRGDSPGKSTEVGCPSLLQEIFPTQGSNPGLLLDRQIPYHWVTWEATWNANCLP